MQLVRMTHMSRFQSRVLHPKDIIYEMMGYYKGFDRIVKGILFFLHSVIFGNF